VDVAALQRVGRKYDADIIGPPMTPGEAAPG
jgi:hypothetical protein